PREAQTAIFDATGIGKSYIHGANRLLLRAAAGAGDASDAYTKGAAHTTPNAFRQRDGNLRADRAFCENHLWRDIRPSSLEFVAVANYAAKKIRRAAGDAGQALGEQAPSAAFRRCDGGTVQRQLVRDHFLEGLAILAENPIGQRDLDALHNFVERFLCACG